MNCNTLKLNDRKTKSIVFTSRHNVDTVTVQNVEVDGSKIKNLDVTFDQMLSMQP